jgi:dTDP-4-dehydrorhamnose 3,5-epimerase
MEKIDHKTFEDERGSFTPIPLDVLGETWDQCSIATNDKIYTFRGLHYQTNPPQRKYIKVIKGMIVDFSVDVETLESEYLYLTENDAVEIPAGRAHGYLTLSPGTIVAYLVKGEYNPQSEHSIVWDQCKGVRKVVNFITDGEKITISQKDKDGK